MKVKKNYKEIFQKILLFIFCFTIIELLLMFINNKSLILSLYRKNTLRELQNSSNNNYNQELESEDKIDLITLFFFIFYVIFLILVIYIIIEIKKLGSSVEYLRSDVFIYMYMANGGFFFTTICYISLVKDTSLGKLALYISGVIFVIETIIFLVDFFKNTVHDCCKEFRVSEILCYYFKIPCDGAYSFISYTDPCCIQDTYTVTTYSDGSTSSTEGCVRCCNCFSEAIKKIVFFISFVLFYAYFICISILFLIIKLIHTICCSCTCNCCCKKENNEVNIKKNNEININEKENQVSNQNLNEEIQGNNVVIHYQQTTNQNINNKMEVNSELENDLNQVKSDNTNQIEEISVNKNENINISNNQVSDN